MLLKTTQRPAKITTVKNSMKAMKSWQRRATIWQGARRSMKVKAVTKMKDDPLYDPATRTFRGLPAGYVAIRHRRCPEETEGKRPCLQPSGSLSLTQPYGGNEVVIDDAVLREANSTRIRAPPTISEETASGRTREKEQHQHQLRSSGPSERTLRARVGQ